MTKAGAVRTVSSMLPKFTHGRRDQYLRRLAREPIFQGVPRHLMPAIGRSVDELHLRPGASTTCDPAREVIVVAEGEALLRSDGDQSLAVVGVGGAIGGAPPVDAIAFERITAISPLRYFVIARRELAALRAMAPALAATLDRARRPLPTTAVARVEPPVTSTLR
jgi:hypothetical protein